MFLVSTFENLLQDKIKPRKTSDGARQESDEVAFTDARVCRYGLEETLIVMIAF
jgi:hypothetical protein